MPDERFDSFRLVVMQDVLPVGLALLERARVGGAAKLVEAFTDSVDPLEDLRTEGEDSAKSIRQKLDAVSPGLGNPVISVKVEVDEQKPACGTKEDMDELINVLTRIESRLDILETYLEIDDDLASGSSH